MFTISVGNVLFRNINNNVMTMGIIQRHHITPYILIHIIILKRGKLISHPIIQRLFFIRYTRDDAN